MTTLLCVLLATQVQAVALGAGASTYSPGTGPGPEFGIVSYQEVAPRFRIEAGISYWTRNYRSESSYVQRNSTFSDLSLHEAGFAVLSVSDRLVLGAGGGLSVHLLKNYVRERVDYGSVIVTEYYAKTANRLGLGLGLFLEYRIGRCSVAVKADYTALVMATTGENLFYQEGNIRIIRIRVELGLWPGA
jgi:hypothetical protein